MTVGRRAARAILIDDHDRLVLIKRMKPGQALYWTVPGGGVDDTDDSVEAALHRELAEELGAAASGASRVFMFSSPSDAGIAVQYFFVARLIKLDVSARSGPEFDDPSRGAYDVDRIDLRGEGLASIDLKPVALKEFILFSVRHECFCASDLDGNKTCMFGTCKMWNSVVGVSH
jgi:ADP-ribose pyrophosphatase YjhB (NUDIX family)